MNESHNIIEPTKGVPPNLGDRKIKRKKKICEGYEVYTCQVDTSSSNRAMTFLSVRLLHDPRSPAQWYYAISKSCENVDCLTYDPLVTTCNAPTIPSLFFPIGCLFFFFFLVWKPNVSTRKDMILTTTSRFQSQLCTFLDFALTPNDFSVA